MIEKQKVKTKVHAVRLPVHILDMLRQLANEEYRTLNDQILMFLEDGLVKTGWLKEEERRKR